MTSLKLPRPHLEYSDDRSDADALLSVIKRVLEDQKVLDPVVIDLVGRSHFADYMYVASGRSSRHVAAMAGNLLRALKKSGYDRLPVEGLPQGDWVLIDAGDVVVHLFRPEVRAFYKLEKIWGADAPVEPASPVDSLVSVEQSPS